VAAIEPGGNAVEVVEPGVLAAGAEEGHDDLAVIESRTGDEAVAGGVGVAGLAADDVPFADDERLVGGAVVDARVVVLGHDLGGVLAHDGAQDVVGERGAQRDRHLARGGLVAAQARGVGEFCPPQAEAPGNSVHRIDQLVGRHAGGAAERGRGAVVGRDEHRAQQVFIAELLADVEAGASAARGVVRVDLRDLGPAFEVEALADGHRDEDLGGRCDRADLVGVLGEQLLAGGSV
jgi:hypothetical protein